MIAIKNGNIHTRMTSVAAFHAPLSVDAFFLPKVTLLPIQLEHEHISTRAALVAADITAATTAIVVATPVAPSNTNSTTTTSRFVCTKIGTTPKESSMRAPRHVLSSRVALKTNQVAFTVVIRIAITLTKSQRKGSTSIISGNPDALHGLSLVLSGDDLQAPIVWFFRDGAESHEQRRQCYLRGQQQPPEAFVLAAFT